MEQNKEVVEQKVKQYEYAHLVVDCGKCGSKYVLEKDVVGGLNVNMPTASNALLVLACKECKNTMALYFVESDGASKKDEPKIETAEIKESDMIYEENESGDLEPKMEIVK